MCCFFATQQNVKRRFTAEGAEDAEETGVGRDGRLDAQLAKTGINSDMKVVQLLLSLYPLDCFKDVSQIFRDTEFVGLAHTGTASART